MPKRRRASEAKRAARLPKVLPFRAVEPVGVQVQTDDAWVERTCPTCASPQCTSPSHWADPWD